MLFAAKTIGPAHTALEFAKEILDRIGGLAVRGVLARCSRPCATVFDGRRTRFPLNVKLAFVCNQFCLAADVGERGFFPRSRVYAVDLELRAVPWARRAQ